MYRIICVTWTLLALIVSLVTTILQIEPAIYVIDMIMGNDYTFYVFLAFGITFLILESPILLLAISVIFYYKLKYKMPDITGKTGISIYRKNRLMDGLYPFEIYIDNELKSKIVVGQTIFIEKFSGLHKILVKSGKRKSNELEVEIKNGEIFKTMININPLVNKRLFPQQSKSFNVYTLTKIS